MQYLNVSLSSAQDPGRPGYLNHYFFTDPVFGTNFTYPNTANGSFFYSLSTFFVPEVLYVNTLDPTSYPGTGALVNDISYQANNDLRLNRGAILNRYFSFNSSNFGSLSSFSGIENNLNFETVSSFTLVTVISSTGKNTEARVLNKGHWFFSPGYLINAIGKKVLYGIGTTVGIPSTPQNAFFNITLNDCLNLDKFNHIAFTCNRVTKECALYVNGTKQYTVPERTTSEVIQVSGFDIDITAYNNTLCASSRFPFMAGRASELASDPANTQQFNGLLNTIKVFSRVLSSSEINADYYNSAAIFPQNVNAYSLTADGGFFFPWGYAKQNSTTSIEAGKLKGPYTVTFVLSNIETTYYPVFKILYDFGDGETFKIEKNIVQDYASGNLAEILQGQLVEDIQFSIVSHEYWPTDKPVTLYTPSISVIFSNSEYNIFNVSFSSYPDTIYNIEKFNLLNKADVDSSGKNNFLVVESKYDSRYLNNFLLTRTLSVIDTGTLQPVSGTVPCYIYVDQNSEFISAICKTNYIIVSAGVLNFFIDFNPGFLLVNNNYDVNNYSNCNLTILTTPELSANTNVIYVGDYATLSSINGNFYTISYFTTGSLIIGLYQNDYYLPPITSYPPYPTPTPTPSPSPTMSPTPTPTKSPTPTPTSSPSPTPTSTPIVPTATPFILPTSTPTPTPTPTPTATQGIGNMVIGETFIVGGP